MSIMRDGLGLPRITRATGERLTSGVGRRACTRRAPGSVLIAVAAWLLALIGGGALFVSFSAQYAYIVTVRRQDAASVIEALLLDLLMIVFTLLALGLSRAGKSARAERILILACAAASSYMNVAAADVASPRSVAAYAIAPVALAVVVDRVVAVIRRHVLADQEPSAWSTVGRTAAAAARIAGRVAAVLSAVRPGRAGDGPRATPDGAGRRSPACASRGARAGGDRAAPHQEGRPARLVPRPPGLRGPQHEPAGSLPSWPRRRGCRQEPPAATCTPSWTAGRHDRGPVRGTLAPRSGREPGRPGCAARRPARARSAPSMNGLTKQGSSPAWTWPPGSRIWPRPSPTRWRPPPRTAPGPVLDRPGPRHLSRAAGRPAAVGRHRAPPALQRVPSCGTAGPATSTPSGNCPPWPPSGTATYGGNTPRPGPGPGVLRPLAARTPCAALLA